MRAETGQYVSWEQFATAQSEERTVWLGRIDRLTELIDRRFDEHDKLHRTTVVEHTQSALSKVAIAVATISSLCAVGAVILQAWGH